MSTSNRPGLIKNPTPHQQAIFASTDPALLVNAAAGAGKTSTVVHKMNLIPESEDIVYVVFAKRNADEAKAKVPKHCNAGTLHSLALKGLNSARRYKVNKGKIWDVWKDDLEMNKDATKAYYGFAKRLVGLARAEGIGSLCEDTFETWRALAFEHDLQVQGEDSTITQGIKHARDLLKGCMKRSARGEIDFDDMIYLPTHPDFKATLPRPRHIFVDEAQDLSPVQVEIIAAMCGAKRGEKVVMQGQTVTFVGDRWQAIFGWRGAASNAMDKIKDRFGCAELPLSVCWRCASSFVELAASLGADIQAAPNAIPGTLVHWDASKGSYEVKPGTTVLCRTTAPLISNCYKLIRQGRRAMVLGRDIGEGLVSLVKQMKTGRINDLRSKLGKWLQRELEKLEGREDKQAALEDKVDCITVLMDMLGPDEDTVEDLIAQIEHLFADVEDEQGLRESGAVVFSTIHKAKGLEWDEVVILDAHKMPARWARKAWQQQQEAHCAYVAYTRARSYMALVASEDFERSDVRSSKRGAMDHQLMGE